ncbi:MAG TPA: alpha/beta hydrolase, partial [Longimicrobiales bacterium]|nr:alpha/beta hydrolase [Longimicrobiales bacterium]
HEQEPAVARAQRLSPARHSSPPLVALLTRLPYIAAMQAILASLLLAWLALAAFAWLMADRMIFLPPPPSYSADQPGIMFVLTEDGASVATLHLPSPDAEFTLLFSHGNAEDLGHALPFLELLREAGFGVIGYDYRGYGASTGGRPTARAASRDHAAVYRHATETLGIPPSQIILFGRSVGSGPATELAAELTRAAAGDPARQPAGLILESPFTSTFVVLTRVRLLPFDRFPNLSHIREVEAPVLVIHGTDDEVIPVAHGRRVYDAAPGPKQALWVEGARHNDVLSVAGARYFQALQEFAGLVRRSDPAAPPAPY